jgi:hypothetical protein
MRARLSPRTSADRGRLADRGKSLRKSCNCDLEIVAARCQRHCQDRIPGVGSIENPRSLLFSGNVALDHPQQTFVAPKAKCESWASPEGNSR